LQQRRPHQNQESDERGDRIAWQSKNGAVIALTEEKRFTGFDLDPPKINGGPDRPQRSANQIALSD
jgi:hypothetical protein